MQKAKDFEMSTISGEFCYYFTSVGNLVAVLRQPLYGNSPDPDCPKKVVKPARLPKPMKKAYEAMVNGGFPVVT